MNTSREMPRYQSHKQIRALKIEYVKYEWSDDSQNADFIKCTLTPEDEGYDPFEVSEAYTNKHNPYPGGYYVMYENKYESFSPAKEFEAGYSLIGDRS